MTSPPHAEVNTKLENMLNGLPHEVQSIVRPLTSPFLEAVEMVSGDPDDLCRAAEVWQSAASQVRDLRSQHISDVRNVRERWKGESSDAFCGRAQQVGDSLEGVAENLDGTADLLVRAAEGCAEAANLIIDILVDLVTFLISDLLVSLALAAASAGTSLAAGAAGAAARAAASFAKVTKVIGELARLLERLREMFQKLKSGLEAYRQGFQLLKSLKKETSAFAKDGLIIRGVKSAYTAPVRVPAGQAIGHPVPGGAAGAGFEAGRDVYQYSQTRSGEIPPSVNRGK